MKMLKASLVFVGYVVSTTNAQTQTTTGTAAAFSPAPTCTSPPLSMFLNQGNRVWINYPYPASGTTISACYPQALLTSLETPYGSPATTSLSCPDWYTTATRYTSNYAVCCPTSYTLALPPTGAPSSRPALSATCFSNLPSPTTVIAWDNVTITATQGYNNPTAQAFALALDGFVAVTETQTQTRAPSANTAKATLTAANMASTSSDQPKKMLSGSAIAGAAAGAGIAIFILIFVGAFFLASYYRKVNNRAGRRGAVQFKPKNDLKAELDDDGKYWKNMLVKNVTTTRLELPAGRLTPVAEGGTSRLTPNADL